MHRMGLPIPIPLPPGTLVRFAVQLAKFIIASAPVRTTFDLVGGPGAGFFLAACVVLIIVGTGGVFRFEADFPIFWRFRLGIGPYEAHAPLYDLVFMLLMVNILWGLLNLLPVFRLMEARFVANC
jgi:hypothetical protein